jgi:hypothetical protein
MASPTSSGTGKVSPFGDGRGGNGVSVGAGNDFVTNPRGTSAPGPTPRDLTRPVHPNVQKSGGDPALDGGSVPDGGPLPFKAPTEKYGNPLGAGTPGKPPPFRLKG